MDPRALLPGIPLAQLERVLRPATVAFLGLPILIFAVGWLRPAVAVIAAAAAIVALAPLTRGGAAAEPDPAGSAARVSPLALLAALAPAAALVLSSGAGGLEPRNWDWLKHDAILKDLIVQPWPVLYGTEAGTTGLVYYVAYFLPAATVGALAGWKAAHLAVVVTSLAGVALAVLWLVVLARGAPILCGAAFALYSGMDALGVVLLNGSSGLAQIRSNYYLENWSGHWQYSCTPSLLNFVPNQAIAGWLLVALLVDAVRRDRAAFPFAVLPVVGLLWSPFVALGLLPLALASALAHARPLAAVVRAQANRANLAAALLGMLLVTYFAARFGPLALPERLRQAGAAAAAGAFWFVPSRVPLADFAVRYLLFVACEFAVLCLLLVRAQRSDGEGPAMRRLLLAAGCSLLVLPWFHYGIYNDLVMRASIPACFVLLVAALQALRRGTRSATSVLVAAVLVVGAIYPANLMRWHVVGAARSLRFAALRPMASVRSLFQLQLHDGLAQRLPFVTQYLGGTDTPFYRFLARRSTAAEVVEHDPAARPTAALPGSRVVEREQVAPALVPAQRRGARRGDRVDQRRDRAHLLVEDPGTRHHLDRDLGATGGGRLARREQREAHALVRVDHLDALPR